MQVKPEIVRRDFIQMSGQLTISSSSSSTDVSPCLTPFLIADDRADLAGPARAFPALSMMLEDRRSDLVGL